MLSANCGMPALAVLQQQGHRTVVARSGGTAVAQTHQNRFVQVLLSLDLPTGQSSFSGERIIIKKPLVLVEASH